jgi:hypothetical protein
MKAGTYVVTRPSKGAPEKASAKASDTAVAVLRSSRAAKVASALRQANNSTGFLSREGQTGRSKK